MNYIVVAVLTLGGVALLAAVVLYIVSRRFAVKEDPRVKDVQECLPGANCGGCGFAGCAALAEALVKGADKGSLDGLRCPVGGDEAMGKIADVLGMAAQAAEPMVAVVRCNGSCDKRGKVAVYEGLHTCAAVNAAGAGESGCGYGCLGCGDCADACQFGGIVINPATGLPEVDGTDVYRLWQLCQGMSSPRHRTAQEGPQGSSRLCGLCQPRPRTHSPQVVSGCLHRLWQVREGLSLWRHHCREQSVVYRLQQMPYVYQVCG